MAMVYSGKSMRHKFKFSYIFQTLSHIRESRTASSSIWLGVWCSEHLTFLKTIESKRTITKLEE